MKYNHLVNHFIEIWKHDNVDVDLRRDKKESDLSDSEYIMYKFWLQDNERELYRKYSPNTIVHSGSMGRKDKIIFHGGCQDCKSQSVYGIDRCKGCMYFRCDWSKPDLSGSNIDGIVDRLKSIIKELENKKL